IGKERAMSLHLRRFPRTPGLLPIAGLLLATPLGAQVTRRVSVSSSGAQGDADCFSPTISADGRCVAFASGATNLVPGDVNGFQDVFVRDRIAGMTALVSVATSGAPADGDCLSPSLSADGRFVAFKSTA